MSTRTVLPLPGEDGSGAQSSTPLFGRAWWLSVYTASGGQLVVSSDAWDPEALRVTFDIQQSGYTAFWWADICIYNANAATEQILIEQGDDVILNAGYQKGDNYGLIFTGKVFQPMWERENVTDYKITLRCFVGLEQVYQNFVSASFARLSTQTDIVAGMAKQARSPIQIDSVDMAALRQKKLSRGKPVFGSPSKYFGQIADENYFSTFMSERGLTLGDLAPSGVPDVTYAPALPPTSTLSPTAGVNYTLIGTPQQTQEGVNFRVLLDSRLKVKRPGMQAKLDMTQIRQLPLTFGASQSVVAPFEKTGTYIIAGVRHHGDTRGNDWYTDITGVTQNGLLQAIRG